MIQSDKGFRVNSKKNDNIRNTRNRWII